MPIANPTELFTSGDEVKAFTYEGGKKLYQWSPYDSGLSKTMEMNIMFHANNEKHAASVVHRMLVHIIDCAVASMAVCRGSSLIDNYMAHRHEGEVAHAEKILRAKEQWKFTEVPKTHVYKVSWASNDTV